MVRCIKRRQQSLQNATHITKIKNGLRFSTNWEMQLMAGKEHLSEMAKPQILDCYALGREPSSNTEVSQDTSKFGWEKQHHFHHLHYPAWYLHPGYHYYQTQPPIYTHKLSVSATWKNHWFKKRSEQQFQPHWFEKWLRHERFDQPTEKGGKIRMKKQRKSWIRKKRAEMEGYPSSELEGWDVVNDGTRNSYADCG